MKENAALLQKAIEYASLKHRGQTRKGDGRPYILHPLSVLQRLWVIKRSKNIYLLAIVAVLHDLVEDCYVTLEEIAQNFGYKVAALVEELTSDKEEMIKQGGKANYLLNKMNNMSSYALVIKLIDRLDNIEDMVNLSDAAKAKTKEETLTIINGLNRKLSKTHLKIIKAIKHSLNVL